MNLKAWNFIRTNPLTLAAALLAPALLGARGCETAVVGTECGGLQGVACGGNLYCDFPVEAVCGAADQTGSCRARPEICTAIFDPVCGCDGQTYPNVCEANAKGVSVASTDACPTEPGGALCGGIQGLVCEAGEFCNFGLGDFCGAADATGTCQTIPEVCGEIFAPVCGCDDTTYENECSAHRAGVAVVSIGACASEPEPRACSGLLGLPCDAGEFCDFAIGDFCGAADATGICKPIPSACDAILAPVCGCDDQSYDSDCEANRAGVSVARSGACAGDPAGGGICGGLLGAQCAADEFCNFAPGDFCGAADATGVCTRLPEACDLILAPVCGCDGRTYDNDCLANSSGTSVVSSGACEPDPNERFCGGLLGLSCEAGEFCDFAIEASCGAADQTGVCRLPPEVCADIFNPVCGCDGETYPNACNANAAGTAVASEGACSNG
jgi:hypothetical protein